MRRQFGTLAIMTRAFLFVLAALSLQGLATGLAPQLHGDEARALAPQEERIAFVTDRDENWEVYVMWANGTDPTNLSRFPINGGYTWPSTDVKPTWSPDGERIAFSSDRYADFRADPDGNRDIFVVVADGTGLVRLTVDLAHDDFPAWSPDGRHIAFSSDRTGDWEIYVMNIDGSGVTQLTDEPGADAMPAWSPDGERIAFVSSRDGNPEIYVMRADGAEPVRLTDEWRMDFSPAWSPDGQYIAFVSDRFISEILTDVEIYIMKADGSEVTNITNTRGIDTEPAWSPDGSAIAFMSRRDGNAEVYVMNADGSDQTNVTNDPANDFLPSWQPRGPRPLLSEPSGLRAYAQRAWQALGL